MTAEVTENTFRRLHDGGLVGLAHAIFHPSTWTTRTCCYLGDLFVARPHRGPGASYSGGSFFGPGVPLVIGLGFLLLGVILEILWRLSGHESFFGPHPENLPPEVAEGRVRVQETAGAPPD